MIFFEINTITSSIAPMSENNSGRRSGTNGTLNLQRAPAGCMCSVQAIEHRAYTTRHKLHKDQIAYNNLGLAFAQAARYAAVAFVDVDERPGNFGLARAVDHELRHKQLPFLLALRQL